MEKILKYRGWIIGISLAFTVIVSTQLFKIQIDPDLRNYFPPGMESMINTTKIEDVFGNQDIVVMLFSCEDVLNGTTLERIKNIEKDLKKINGIIRTTSLFGLNHIHGEEGVMYVDPSVGKIPVTVGDRERLRAEITANEMVYKVVVADDFKSASIIITTDKKIEEESLFRDIESIVAKYPGEEEIMYGGMPYLRVVISRYIKRDGLLLVPLSLILMLIFLYSVFRESGGVLLPFMVVSLSTLVAISFIPLLGWKFSIITLLAPIILIASVNGYGIHVYARYQEVSKSGLEVNIDNLLVHIINKLWVPILLSALTTIAGISSLLTHSMLPARQMAVIALIGIFFSIFFSLVLLPAIMSSCIILKPKSAQVNMTADRIGYMEKMGDFVVKHPSGILIISLIITIIISIGMINLRVDSNEENFFPEKHSVKRAAKLINEKFGGSHIISIMFNGDMMDPLILNKIDYYATELKKMDQVDVTNGFPDVIKEISKALNDPESSLYNVIPTNREAISQYMMLYSMNSDPSELEQLIDFNYTNSHLIVRIKDASNSSIKEVIHKIKEMAHNDENVVAIGGYGYVMSQFADKVVKGQFTSLPIAFIIIFILLAIIFRSIKAGFIGIIPLIVSVLLLFGVMGFADIPLDVATALLSSVMIGVGVDYTIHFFWRYKDEYKISRDKSVAIKRTLSSTGKGIIFNAFSVMIGFSVLMVSSFTPIRFFGILVCLTVFACLVGALLIIPALVMKLPMPFLENKL